MARGHGTKKRSQFFWVLGLLVACLVTARIPAGQNYLCPALPSGLHAGNADITGRIRRRCLLRWVADGGNTYVDCGGAEWKRDRSRRGSGQRLKRWLSR